MLVTWDVTESGPIVNRGPSITKGPSVEFRAKGSGPEFEPCEFQVRRPGEEWPEKWIDTSDLAGTVSALGLDVVWSHVPTRMQDYAQRRTDELPFEA